MLADGLPLVRAAGASGLRGETGEQAESAQGRGAATGWRFQLGRMMRGVTHQELSNRIDSWRSCIGLRLGPLIILPR